MTNRWTSFCVSLLFAVLLLGMVGCRTVTDYTAYQSKAFRAEVTGETYGVPFSAVISASGAGSELTITYLSSDSLEGIIVEIHADGSATMTRGEMEILCERSAVSGLISPVSILFDTGELQSVRKEGDLTRLSFVSGGEMVLSSDLIPMRVDFGDVCYEVVWWETSENVHTGMKK